MSESHSPRAWFPLLFGLTLPVSRGTYARVGLGLALAKYALDALVVYAVTGRFWSPLAYLNPAFTSREELFRAAPPGLLLALGLASLPFIWVGLSMTMRRAVDAGKSAWLGLLFLVPYLNYALMLTLCLLPGKRRPVSPARVEVLEGPLRSALAGVAAGVLFAVAMVFLSVYVLKTYGGALFLGTPVAMGAMSGYALNRDRHHSLRATFGVAVLTVLLAGGVLLLFAVEGVICLLMALPPAVAGSMLGALFGRAVASQGAGPAWQGMLVLLVVPLLAGADAAPRVLPLREVTTAIDIQAPPERVWAHVVGFGELPPADGWLFRMGVAAPRRARIQGEGVGAVRHCEFTTGPFVEPITRWEPPLRLSFDVTAQPAPMEEWSPYRHIHPPHLDGFFRSRRGEFRLVPLRDGGTRLEGTTWYQLDLGPDIYWNLWTEWLLHSIHRQVLGHVRRLAEA